MARGAPYRPEEVQPLLLPVRQGAPIGISMMQLHRARQGFRVSGLESGGSPSSVSAYCERLPWRVEDDFITPVASGSMLWLSSVIFG